MSNLLQGFLLGNAAILTNVCILPLYPGMIAYLAARSGTDAQGATSSGRWLGLAVFTGIVTLMLGVGALLFVLQGAFSTILPVLLPLIYATVLILGILMLLGRNPFARLATLNAPLLRNRFLGAFLYGMLLGPMTLPCAGPIVVTALLVGVGSAASLAGGIAYFLAFALGFGWPLILLPIVAFSFQRRFIHWTTANEKLLTRLSGVMLVAIAVAGFALEVLPNLAWRS
jgi:cytochrome c-type biogenesis protein